MLLLCSLRILTFRLPVAAVNPAAVNHTEELLCARVPSPYESIDRHRRRVRTLKVNPLPDYPPEDGRYIRGNDFSPPAVAIILNFETDNIPRELETLVRAGDRRWA